MFDETIWESKMTVSLVYSESGQALTRLHYNVTYTNILNIQDDHQNGQFRVDEGEKALVTHYAWWVDIDAVGKVQESSGFGEAYGDNTTLNTEKGYGEMEWSKMTVSNDQLLDQNGNVRVIFGTRYKEMIDFISGFNYSGGAQFPVALGSAGSENISFKVGLTDLVPGVPYPVSVGKWFWSTFSPPANMYERAENGLLLYHSITKGFLERYPEIKYDDEFNLIEGRTVPISKVLQDIKTYGVVFK